MDNRRFILYAIFAVIIYSLWTSWQQDYPEAIVHMDSSSSQPDANTLLPMSKGLSDKASRPLSFSDEPDVSNKMISVKTDVLSLNIDQTTGNIVHAKLLKFPESVDEPNTPITLFNQNPNTLYNANSHLFTLSQGQVQPINVRFDSDKDAYELGDADKLVVVLHGQNSDGLSIRKEYTLTKGQYLIELNYAIDNTSEASWKGYLNTQLVREAQEEKSSLFQIGSYTGASYSNPGHFKYKKLSFKDMSKTNLDVESHGGWVAMQQHYFLSAWVPSSDAMQRLYSRASNNTYAIGMVSPSVVVAPNQTKSIRAKLYVGPENTASLAEIAKGLDLTVDYGWLWIFSSFLFKIMQAIHSVIGNWGWSIVLVTVLIKLVFYRLSATSYKSMAAMRKLQPKLEQLKERFGDDKAKISQATMELYKKEKVNPLGGCLPILIQIPVFIALYWVLLESVELRQAPFILWINDLSTADPYHILPIIMGATMLIQQKLSPTPPDPTQAKVMMLLPVVFTALFWNFPAGLVLYWIVNNSLSILQQWYITRQYGDDKKAAIVSKNK